MGFELLGDWTSGAQLVRLLDAVRCPWVPGPLGLVHRETRERAQIRLVPRQRARVAALLEGWDDYPAAVDHEVRERALRHRSCLIVKADAQEGEPLQSALTCARAASALVDGGAVVVRCRTSGGVQPADAFQEHVAAAERAGAEELAVALLHVYVRFHLALGRTVGMAVLGAPDVALDGLDLPERVAARLEHHARALLAGEREGVEPDRERVAPALRNPLGVVRFPSGSP